MDRTSAWVYPRAASVRFRALQARNCTAAERSANTTQASASAPDRDEVRRLLAALEQPLPSLAVGGHAVRLTTLHRVYWPEVPALGEGAITKLDLIRYLVKMSPLVLLNTTTSNLPINAGVNTAAFSVTNAVQ